MRNVVVYGPAYLDRVLRVDRPILDSSQGGPVDQGADVRWEPGQGLVLADPGGGRLRIELPEGWPGPNGTARLDRELVTGGGDWSRTLRGVFWKDDLGGMGSGFAKALGGTLVCPLGDEGGLLSSTVLDRLRAEGIAVRPILVPGGQADWTLLVTSGEHGDKLPLGSRGLLASLETLGARREPGGDLVVVASLNNRLAIEALRISEGATRLLAPTTRTMLDRDPPLTELAGHAEVLSCNRREWESLETADREAVEAQVAVVAVTDGAAGATLRFQSLDGGGREVRVPAFPRRHPPLDTNRAGEAFASTLVAALVGAGWRRGPVVEGLVERSARRASAASALVLDRRDFGFPSESEVDQALRRGVVGP